MVKASKYFKEKLGDLTFGQMVWSHRKSEEMSQTELAELLGVSKQYISQLENGDRFASVEQAARLAEVFAMSPEIFVVRALQDLVNRAGLDIKIRSA